MFGITARAIPAYPSLASVDRDHWYDDDGLILLRFRINFIDTIFVLRNHAI